MKDGKENLADIEVGCECVVTGFEDDGGRKQRFMDLGLMRGARVVCVGKSPFGNPRAYLVRGAIIAIRNNDARSVRVSTFN